MEHICNLCGETCTLGKDAQFPDFEAGLIGAKVSGGYESTPGNGHGTLDDLALYEFNLCEFCLDWLFGKFKVPVSVSEYSSERRIMWRPAAQRVAEDEWRSFKDEFYANKAKRDAARGQ